jgi:NAD(P)-dependent dehydrogenase (short-subunit alcohol dehydrogenase family)
MNTRKKIAVVTGASSGIGFGIANDLSNLGCKVIINSRSKKKLESASKKIKGSIPISADLSCPSEAQSFYKSVKEYAQTIDLLICNAGNSSSVTPGKEKFKDWDKMFRDNFYSAINIIEVTKSIITKNTGSIVCISSICGIDFIPGAPITYSVAKAALNHYIKLSSKEFAKKGIRINGIAPGNIIFKDSVWDKKNKSNPRQVKKIIDENVALKRLGEISDITSLVKFLSSPDSAFITGAIVPADGGQLR